MVIETKNSSPAVKVGGSEQMRFYRRFSFHAPNKNVLTRTLIILAVIFVAWWVYNNYSGGAVFMIDGKKYHKSEVKKLAAYQTDTQHTKFNVAAKKVYTELLYQTASKKTGITVTRTELTRYEPDQNGQAYKKYKIWFDVLAYNRAVAAKLPPPTANQKEGYAYVFWFGDAVQPSYGNNAPSYGNQQAYQSDRDYASQRANYYHDQLKAKKISPKQALTDIKNDPRLAPYHHSASNPSQHFGQQNYVTWQTELDDKAMIDYISQLSAPTLSPVETGKTATTLGPSPTQFADAYYWIAYVQSINTSNITQRFNNALAHLKSRYYGV